jgi:hypothetical protein
MYLRSSGPPVGNAEKEKKLKSDEDTEDEDHDDNRPLEEVVL